MIQTKYIVRLTETIKAAGIAIDGVRSDGTVYPANFQTAAQSIIDNFVQTDAAQQTWLDSKLDVDYSTLINSSQNAFANNNSYMAIGSPTQAQAIAQVGKLTQQATQIINVLLKLVKK